MKDETAHNTEHETEIHRESKSVRQYERKREASFFQQPILFHLNLRILATPRAHRTSDQTERVLETHGPDCSFPTLRNPPTSTVK